MKYRILEKTPDADGIAFKVLTQETIAGTVRQKTHDFRIGRGAFEAASNPPERADIVVREVRLHHRAWLESLRPPAQQAWIPDDATLPVGVTVDDQEPIP